MTLQDIRISKGFSQKQLAELTNMNHRTLQHYEQGVRDINGAKLETLLNLASVLECKISDIITDPNLVNKCKEFSI